MEKLLNEFKIALSEKIENYILSKKSAYKKSDLSLVTEIDIFVSDFFKEKLSKIKEYEKFNFYSEEDFSDYHFPCIVLDPIDGTREFVKGISECAVSLAIMHSPDLKDGKNFSWLFNPFSGFEIQSQISFFNSRILTNQKLLGLVSRSEMIKGLFTNHIENSQFALFPRGSIAFKLGLLASGGCDFVISLNPKNVWDIAAGTHICFERKIFFYVNGKKIESLDSVKYDGVLLWATEEIKSIIYPQFQI